MGWTAQERRVERSKRLRPMNARGTQTDELMRPWWQPRRNRRQENDGRPSGKAAGHLQHPPGAGAGGGRAELAHEEIQTDVARGIQQRGAPYPPGAEVGKRPPSPERVTSTGSVLNPQLRSRPAH